mmetsp:Transcript_23261/g.39765  ORF Transcript_23261/g.39765 Transcript_23261/m.39765 type:complete len:202 (+) Transcript_23261:304-909(+)|eukprot:CAMPEP_0183762294 /NCGR_PEP_ID=MMETSP0739-20130205/8984_1 /TAXON_ID=385413 /ORGANISM="Thalassiosira miniscula, Strain CCMP1093" /LENGTH=201 /DNA_ID=CAMNT_0026000559 /DNA_START=281 /DNA_END=886 /DNA_ORIENTATION=+
MNIGLPTLLKSHFLFDYHLQDWLETWETFGGLDEQNIESTHPIFNESVRRYGNSCGGQLKQRVIPQFLMERAAFVLDKVDEMVKGTARAKRPNAKKRGKGNIEALDLRDVRETDTLSELELAMNMDDKLHPTKDQVDLQLRDALDGIGYDDTCVVVCRRCKKRVIKFGMPIHDHEFHSEEIVADFNEEVAARMRIKSEGMV